ncbi:PTS sugar transporter subunit IIA [Mycoplasmopsis synoviae]|uniref:PTS sugar transporter subunit IIA n=1 Tax=Mycoplasmopsis synoviae TaxID=2109 RepID=UPI00349E64EF
MLSKLNFIDNLILNDSIALNQEANSWEEAIKAAIDLLVKANAVSDLHYEKIIESTKEFGPYYVIADNFAMPHAKSESYYVFDTAFSLVTFKNAISFDENKKVKVMICFSSLNGEIYTKVAIPQIVSIFENQENIEKIANFQSKEKLIEFLKSLDYKKYLQ